MVTPNRTVCHACHSRVFCLWELLCSIFCIFYIFPYNLSVKAVASKHSTCMSAVAWLRFDLHVLNNLIWLRCFQVVLDPGENTPSKICIIKCAEHWQFQAVRMLISRPCSCPHSQPPPQWTLGFRLCPRTNSSQDYCTIHFTPAHFRYYCYCSYLVTIETLPQFL